MKQLYAIDGGVQSHILYSTKERQVGRYAKLHCCRTLSSSLGRIVLQDKWPEQTSLIHLGVFFHCHLLNDLVANQSGPIYSRLSYNASSLKLRCKTQFSTQLRQRTDRKTCRSLLCKRVLELINPFVSLFVTSV